jgi:hypothetical protein
MPFTFRGARRRSPLYNVGMPPSLTSYGPRSWGPLPPQSTASGNGRGGHIGRQNFLYMRSGNHQYQSLSFGRKGYESMSGHPPYESASYVADSPAAWEGSPYEEYCPTWFPPAHPAEKDRIVQHRTSAPQRFLPLHRPKKHIPLNWQRVPDTEVDASGCKSLHHDLMKFHIWLEIATRESSASTQRKS